MDSDPNQLQGKQLTHTRARTHTHAHIRAQASTPALIVLLELSVLKNQFFLLLFLFNNRPINLPNAVRMDY